MKIYVLLLSVVVLITAVYGLNFGELRSVMQRIAKDKPNPSINQEFPDNELDRFPNTIYLAQFLNFMLTGSYTGNSTISNDFDNITLDEMLGFGLIIIRDFLTQGGDIYDEDEELFLDLVRIKELLKNNGTMAVTVKDLKPYLNVQTALAVAGVYFALNKDTFKERFNHYLMEEFLGGITLENECKLHTAVWFDSFPQGQFWSIQMFDAIAKMPPGITSGNVNWMGSYDTCKDVFNDTYPPFRKEPLQGKYCRADIGLPVQSFAGDLPIDDKIGLTYGLCVSKQCTNNQVRSIVSNSLKLMTVFKFAKVRSIECEVDSYKLPASTIAFTVLLSILVAFIIIATGFDIYVRISEFANKQHQSDDPILAERKKTIIGTESLDSSKVRESRRSKFATFLIDCSLYNNSVKFFRTDNGGQITCLNGIRVFSMVWIIWGHTYNYISNRDKFFLMDNIISVQKLNEQAWAQIIINGIFGVDTFFIMSAFLLTLSFMKKMEKSGRLTRFEWAYYYIHRYWRLLPPFMITIIIYNYIIPYLGSGPLWHAEDFPPKTDECKQYWWVFLLFLNNFVPNGAGVKCMGYLWYIPNDYQFYAVTPLILIVLYKFPYAGKAIIGGLLSGSLCILAFLASNVYISRKKNIVDVLLDMWDDVYIKPYCRATPWLVGIILGYIFFKVKKVNLRYRYVAICWFLCAGTFIAVLWGGYTNHAANSRRMEVYEYALFFSLTKLAWAVAVSWVIFACHYGYGGIVNSILSCKPYVPITRLTYCAYLIHPPIMLTYNFLQQGLFHAATPSLIYLAVGNIVVSLMLTFPYTLFFEVPFVALEKLVYNPKTK